VHVVREHERVAGGVGVNLGLQVQRGVQGPDVSGGRAARELREVLRWHAEQRVHVDAVEYA
jgi:hypothetical protein